MSRLRDTGSSTRTSHRAPFLSVYTPAYKRPVMLAMCKTSVAEQTIPCEHVIVEDTVGIGIDGVYAAMPKHAHKVHGEYVMVLSDDNVLTHNTFADDLQAYVAEWGDPAPDVVVFKGRIAGTVQPVAWMREPEETKIDLSCFAVRRDVWQANADKWGARYAGDFDFVHSLWAQGFRFGWWDRVGFRALKISNGQPEETPPT